MAGRDVPGFTSGPRSVRAAEIARCIADGDLLRELTTLLEGLEDNGPTPHLPAALERCRYLQIDNAVEMASHAVEAGEVSAVIAAARELESIRIAEVDSVSMQLRDRWMSACFWVGRYLSESGMAERMVETIQGGGDQVDGNGCHRLCLILEGRRELARGHLANAVRNGLLAAMDGVAVDDIKRMALELSGRRIQGDGRRGQRVRGAPDVGEDL